MNLNTTMSRMFTFGLAISAGIFMISCDKFEPAEPNEEDLLDGPLADLTPAESAQFGRGDVAFNDQLFHSATGLGPIFNATSCVSCHAGDGKGTPFTAFIRFGQGDTTGNKYLHMGGPQLQDRALPGYAPETLPEGAPYTSLVASAVTGLGFLQYVTDEDLLALADPDDEDGDGISGVPNWGRLVKYVIPPANAVSKDGKYIHRFGKKASAYDLLQQTVTAYNQDIGITSIFDPIDTYSGLAIEPEIQATIVRDVVFYLETLKAPIPRNQDLPQVISGKNIFSDIGCSSCHIPTMKTGPAPIEALAYKTFHPYTDMLLHDMGPGLDDGYTEGSALTSEWRTPALWGLGLSPDSQGGVYYLLHDGRARSIEEAIIMHGGEAENSKNQYQSLAQWQKDDLLKFLESL